MGWVEHIQTNHRLHAAMGVVATEAEEEEEVVVDEGDEEETSEEDEFDD